MMDNKISVVIVTREEERTLVRCLESLKDFQDVIVVDSESRDKTAAIARERGARVIPFTWNGAYPKKRQWCLDTIRPLHPWVLFIDADEEMTPALAKEIKTINREATGYFLSGRYVVNGRALRFGLTNKKICLLNRERMEFPVVRDLDIPGMGEIEGHYQPVLKAGYEGVGIGRLKAPILHYALEDEQAWARRHERYALWEAEMIRREAYPQDPLSLRQAAKRIFRAMPFRAEMAFLHSYIFALGFLDGREGLLLALKRRAYYRLVRKNQYREGNVDLRQKDAA